jgi:hypothetical protein
MCRVGYSVACESGTVGFLVSAVAILMVLDGYKSKCGYTGGYGRTRGSKESMRPIGAEVGKSKLTRIGLYG